MKYLLFVSILWLGISLQGQDKPYFYQIPAVPEAYSATTVAARMVDGLGFRYFWATEGLREQDLNYQPQGELSGEARTTLETIRHILDLCTIINNTTQDVPTLSGGNPSDLSFAEVRRMTLHHLQTASEILHKNTVNLADLEMVFKNSSGSREYPFWNLINGPIADALWHVGQVVTFRRYSGNPLPSGVSVLQGVKRE